MAKEEIITFDEFVEHGKKEAHSLVNGMPWSFWYKGRVVTHENDDTYLINQGNSTLFFRRGDKLVMHAIGELTVRRPVDDAYPEGFDASCGFSAELMRQANMAAASLNGNRQWDVKCIAAAMEAYAKSKLCAIPDANFCYCGEEISLQMVSGGSAPEGLYGRVTLKVGDEYVSYVRAVDIEMKSPDMISIPRSTLQHWRELVDLNPADLAPRLDAILRRA